MKEWLRPHSIRREDGLTLVELLAVLALTGMLLLLISTVLTTSLLSYGRIDHETRLRNEAITLSTALQGRLVNAAKVTPGGAASGLFTKFKAEVLTDVLNGTTRLTDVSIENGQLFIDGIRQHEEHLTVEGSYFTRGVNDLQLHLKIGLTDADAARVEPLYLFVSVKISPQGGAGG